LEGRSSALTAALNLFGASPFGNFEAKEQKRHVRNVKLFNLNDLFPLSHHTITLLPAKLVGEEEM
jgi:hypothetical protein